MGRILIENYGKHGIYTTESLTNAGQIWITSDDPYSFNGIYNYFGSLHNEPTGLVISFDNILNWYSSELINDGNIYCINIRDDKINGVTNHGFIVNTDSLIVSGTLMGVESNQLLNTSTGNVEIISDGDATSAFINSDSLHNDGKLIITYNDTSSFIAIQNISGITKIVNNGLIDIENINEDDISNKTIGIYSHGQIWNNGEFVIDGCDEAIFNIGPNSPYYYSWTAEFYNNGFLKITDAKKIALQNGGEFISSHGSELFMYNSTEEYPIVDILIGGIFEVVGELDVKLDGS